MPVLFGQSIIVRSSRFAEIRVSCPKFCKILVPAGGLSVHKCSGKFEPCASLHELAFAKVWSDLHFYSPTGRAPIATPTG